MPCITRKRAQFGPTVEASRNGQPRGGLKLRNWVELRERAREGVRETPCRPRSEFFDRRIEIRVVDATCEMLWNIG